MTTISQSLSIPSGLATGQVAAASQITPLYNSLNAFVIPDSLFTFTTELSDNTAYVITAGTTQAWTVSIPQTKAWWAYIPYVAGNKDTKYQIDVNGTLVIADTNLAPNVGTDQKGLMMIFCGPHDGTFAWPFFNVCLSSASTATIYGAYLADLPNATVTSISLKCTAVGPLSVKGIRVWREI